MNPSSRFLAMASLATLLVPLGAQVAPQTQAVESGGDEEAITLSTFEVRSERDYGYRKTNAVTATRIGAEIKQIPLNISVISAELVSDQSWDNVNDIFAYTSGVRAQYSVPVGVAVGTSRAGTYVRGFEATVSYQDGMRRNAGFFLDGIDRVEVVKGPVGLYFGRTEPAGIINYISKRPLFTNRTEIKGVVGSDSYYKGMLDHQNVFANNKLATRLVLSKRDSDSWQESTTWDEEYGQLGLAWRPTGNLQLLLQAEHYDVYKTGGRVNTVVANLDYVEARRNGTLPLLANGLVPDQLQWRQSEFARTGRDPRQYNGAYFPRGFAFNKNGPGSFDDIQREGFSSDLQWGITDDTNLRFVYGYNKTEQLWYWPIVQDMQFNPGPLVALVSGGNPNAVDVLDYGVFVSPGFNRTASSAPGKGGAINTSHNFQADLTHDFELLGGKHSVILSAEWLGDEFDGLGIPTDPDAFIRSGGLPGGVQGFGNDPVSAESNQILMAFRQRMVDAGLIAPTSPIPTPFLGTLLLDTSGPTVAFPDTSEWFRAPTREGTTGNDSIEFSYAASYRGRFFDERLTLFGGVRRTNYRAINTAYQNGGDVRQGNWSEFSANTPTYGALFNVTPDIVAYVSASETFLPTARQLNEVVTNQTTGETRGGNVLNAPEGKGMEIGLKTSLWGDKLGGTISLFQIERSGLVIQDATLINELQNFNQAEVDAGRPPQWFRPNGSPVLPNNNPQIFVNAGLDRVEGLEAEFVYTPSRQFQVIFSASHFFTREHVVKNPTAVNIARGGTFAGANGLNDGRDAYPDTLPQAPEWKFAGWGKYTFTEGRLAGFDFGAGFEYTSKDLIGLEGSNYDTVYADAWVRFDAAIGYERPLRDGRLRAQLNVRNVTDEEILTGSFGLNPLREIRFTLGYTF